MPIKHLSMPELHQIYDQQLHDDFPDNERRSFQNMLDYHEKGLYEAWAKYEDGICLAYSCFLGNQDGLIMDYFAVNKAYRNRGIGSAFLKECLAQYPDTLILIESEKDDGLDPLKKRRLRFLPQKRTLPYRCQHLALLCRLYDPGQPDGDQSADLSHLSASL